VALDEDEHACHPYVCHFTIPAPIREGISSGKQHLSSQNSGFLSSNYQIRSYMRGQLSDWRDKINCVVRGGRVA
jgi:hypothetical protein